MVRKMSIEKKDSWDKAKIYFEILAIVAAVFFGYFINITLKEKEINLQLVQVAIDILRTEPDEKNQPLREWAITAINNPSCIPKFDDKARTTLMKQKLPSVTWQGAPVTWHGEPTTWQGK